MIVKSLLSTFSELLSPLVRVLIRFGIPYRTAMGILRSVYITESEKVLSHPNKKTTVSSISVITGLPRSEISKHIHKDEIQDQANSITKHNKAACIIKFWSEDPLYTDIKGEPKPLSLNGYGENFSTLVKKYAGTVPYQSIFDELLRTKCIELNAQHEVILLRSNYNKNDYSQNFNETLYEMKDETKKMMEHYSHKLLTES